MQLKADQGYHWTTFMPIRQIKADKGYHWTILMPFKADTG